MQELINDQGITTQDTRNTWISNVMLLYNVPLATDVLRGTGSELWRTVVRKADNVEATNTQRIKKRLRYWQHHGGNSETTMLLEATNDPH